MQYCIPVGQERGFGRSYLGAADGLPARRASRIGPTEALRAEWNPHHYEPCYHSGTSRVVIPTSLVVIPSRQARNPCSPGRGARSTGTPRIPHPPTARAPGSE